MSRSGRPRATYRVQLSPSFGFDDAAAVADYLATLGVSHVYCSPFLQAAPGSAHGYDVVDHSRLNEDLGGEAGFDRFVQALDAHGLGQVVDVVPNHMAAIEAHNAWWWDVLENGPASRYADYFDIDWDPPERKLRATVLVPVLEDHIGRVIEAGLLKLKREGGAVVVEYHDHRFPVSPRSLDTALRAAAETVGSAELATIAAGFGRLPHAEEVEPAAVLERHRDKEVLRRWLERICAEDSGVAMAVDAELTRIESDPAALDDLLGRQNYRLAYWRVAGEELDYRRFFDIHTLVGLRVEDERVFRDTHDLIGRLVADGVVDGLRIDHPDGLRDPEGYVRRVAEEIRPAWTVLEKILEPGERLPASWPVDGTTGYDFMNLVLGLFVDPAAEAVFTELYRRFTGEDTDYQAVVRNAKREILADSLRADLYRLTEAFAAVAQRQPRHRDYTRRELRGALTELLVSLDVYRTYVRDGDDVRPEDVATIDDAVARACHASPGLDAELLRFLADVLLLRYPGAEETELALRFQQLSGPVMAKGVEDTAFYRYLRFVALNEVGGDPARFATGIEEFHRRNGETDAGQWPHTMVTTSTHDHKRGEDVRARLAVLSELPDEWSAVVEKWSAMTTRHWRDSEPDRSVEYLLFQTVVGAHPLSAQRAVQYVEKAIREAKRRTSWTDPDADYEAAVRAYVGRVLADDEFLSSVADFASSLSRPWVETALAQVVLKLTVPGVPDIYQGTEVWDLSLVDPDNRRPVDYDARRELLRVVDEGGVDAAMAAMDIGGPKMLAVHRLLRLRADDVDAFSSGSGYEALSFTGQHARRAVGFVRGGRIAVVVPRLAAGRGDGWGDTSVDLPPGRWHNLFTAGDVDGGEVALRALLGRFPVAVLRLTR